MYPFNLISHSYQVSCRHVTVARTSLETRALTPSGACLYSKFPSKIQPLQKNLFKKGDAHYKRRCDLRSALQNNWQGFFVLKNIYAIPPDASSERVIAVVFLLTAPEPHQLPKCIRQQYFTRNINCLVSYCFSYTPSTLYAHRYARCNIVVDEKLNFR